MSLNPTGGIPSWNYTKPDKDNYTQPDANGQQSIVGTIVSIQEVQARKWRADGQLGAPDTWDDGKPKMNIRIGLALPDGTIRTFTFGKAGKEARAGRKPSVHMSLFGLTGNTDMMKLVGKTVQLTTWPANPTTGQAWGNGNPRLFDVQEVPGVGPFTLAGPLPSELTVPELLCNDGAAGGQPTAPAPATVMVPNVQVQQAVATQPVAVTPVASQPAVAAVPAQGAMPAGMDPAVAAAMDAIGAVNVQPVATDPYNDEIPF